MRYNSTIPVTALLFLLVIIILMELNIIPDTESIIAYLESFQDQHIWIFLFVIIFIESIIYLGFYFPGQFIAVLVVVLSDGSFTDLGILTLISIVAVVLSATFNFYLGYFLLGKHEKKTNKIDYKELLVSIIHINVLALYLYKQGAINGNRMIIPLTGLLNLPYYILLIFGTYTFRDQIVIVAQTNYILLSLLLIWLAYSLYKDIKLQKISLSNK